MYCYYYVYVYRRIERLLTARQQMIKQRKETAIQTKMEKDRINKLMEEVRTDASKANKIITMAMQGKVSLNSIGSGALTPASTTKKKKSKSQTDRSASFDGMRRPKSEAGNDRSHSASDMNSSQNRQNNNRNANNSTAPQQHTRFELDDGLANPLPYISPYDTSNSNAAPSRGGKVTL
jgi:hypothetical protein